MKMDEKIRLFDKMYEFINQYGMLSTFIDEFMADQEEEHITKDHLDSLYQR